MELRIGTAGWTIPAALRAGFAGEGRQLERYARRVTCVEITSSFYRPHRAATYARWAAATPDAFRFAVKLPRELTHHAKLAQTGEILARFLEETAALGPKRAVVLVQLPPSLAFDGAVAGRFFAELCERCDAAVVCEPRHPSWFAPEADALLRAGGVARAAADPAVVPAAGRPGGSPRLAYYRWHGSPVVYRSAYPPERLDAFAAAVHAERSETAWCIFDNTAAGAALADALAFAGRAA